MVVKLLPSQPYTTKAATRRPSKPRREPVSPAAPAVLVDLAIDLFTGTGDQDGAGRATSQLAPRQPPERLTTVQEKKRSQKIPKKQQNSCGPTTKVLGKPTTD